MMAVCGAACTASITWYFGGPKDKRNQWIPIASEAQCVFLFDGRAVSSATSSAEALIRDQGGDTDWDKLRHALIDRFHDFPAEPGMTEPVGTTLLEPSNTADPWRVLIEPLGETIRVELASRENVGKVPALTHFLEDSKTRELSGLRHATENAPYPIWRVNHLGLETWHNAAYEELYLRATGSPSDPAKPLFSGLALETDTCLRQKLDIAGAHTGEWHDVTRLGDGTDHLYFALNVTPVVRAETAQRNFVQTLAKTFAQLSIGLAIFDRNMQLALFNPALTDLTALPPEFLSARPDLLSFFDRLRDARVMPEPKDYGSWREQMSSMVAQAADGRYSETWALPSGSTYRVTGRPHPDGAVAFLFEDISAEVSLTRRFRADLELNQNILDQIEDAVAVFSASGTLSVTNEPYCRLWHIDPDSSFADISVVDSMRHWREAGGSQPLWGDIRDFVLNEDNRTTWGTSVTFPDGREFQCWVHPMQHGATLLRFSPTEPALTIANLTR